MGKSFSKTWGPMRRVAMVLTVASVAACTAQIRNHGYIPTEDQLSLVNVGVDTAETVLAALGPATSGSVLEGGNLYYVSSQFRHVGAFAPVETDRQVMAISFAADGTLANIEQFGLQEGRVVVLSRRVTDSGIRDTTFVRQLLGSFGQFDAGSFIGES